MIYENISQTIGSTPIVRLNRVSKGLNVNLFGKLEYFNPGGSIKDRLGWWLVEDAEKRGYLKPGGTLVEGTSGNTGFGLAIAAAMKGYKCIFVLPDKMSDEKIKNLRAFGAKVVVTPTSVEPEDPRSYYSVSKRLAVETPNAYYVNQYNNLANRECHLKTTGPEIHEQMPDIDVLIAGIGTGGTICGTGAYFKQHKPDVEIVAVDPVGSIVYDKFKTGKEVHALPYKIEGIGEDFIPENYDFDVINDMVQVEDKESFLMTRELLVKEGIYSGVSSGAAVQGAIRWIKEQGSRLNGKNILVILPDSGNRYLSKVYDDEWMREQGYLEEKGLGTVEELLHSLKKTAETIHMVKQTDKVSAVIDLMNSKGISQVPVVDSNGWIKGMITEGKLLNAIYSASAKPTDIIERLVDSHVEFVKLSDSIEKVSRMITDGKHPIVTSDVEGKDFVAIITKIDLLTYMSNLG
ncbi:MAG: pyridoxal-5'-phosphate-dependent protein subunit beta [Bdellovibrionaceae bacterium]|nr:pyridoxal-5'-phosphate-dependent protein subunit beta [Pseudobdellovibrionaceae bacterium]|tara:strand:- start:159 stop:1544 length:1386 start_codon:yes stop_codon:yes gene_type:complete